MTITDERTQTQFPAPAPTAFERAEQFWQSHPTASAGLSFVLTAACAGSTVRFALAQDFLWMTAAYLGALAAGMSGAFECVRAGQGGAR
jgi:hypothetical protein